MKSYMSGLSRVSGKLKPWPLVELNTDANAGGWAAIEEVINVGEEGAILGLCGANEILGFVFAVDMVKGTDLGLVIRVIALLRLSLLTTINDAAPFSFTGLMVAELDDDEEDDFGLLVGEFAGLALVLIAVPFLNNES